MKPKTRELLILVLFLALTAGTTAVVVSQHESGAPALPAKSSLAPRFNKQKGRLRKLVEERRFSDAEIAVRRLLRLEPDNLPLRRWAGKICYRNGKYREAAKFFLSLLRLNPEDPVCRCNYALALAGAGSFNAALSQFRRAYKDSGNALYAAELYREVGKRCKKKIPELEGVPSQENIRPQLLLVPEWKMEKEKKL